MSVLAATLILTLTPIDSADGSDVVAHVNGEAVTRVELDRVLDDPLERRRLERELEGSHAGTTLEALALRELIHRHLLLQEAERLNLEVSDRELDEAIGSLRRRFETLHGFASWMSARGLDDRSLIAELRRQIALSKAWEAVVADARPSDSDVRDYFDAHAGDLVVGAEVRLRMIVVADLAAGERILEALHQGSPFSIQARDHSLGRLAVRGGDTGWIDVETLPTELQRAVAMLEPGDVAGPLPRADGRHLLVGLVGSRPVPPSSLADARPEIERRLLPELRGAAFKAWLDEATENADIERHITTDEKGADSEA